MMLVIDSFACLLFVHSLLFNPNKKTLFWRQRLYFLFTEVFIGNNNIWNRVGAQELVID